MASALRESGILDEQQAGCGAGPQGWAESMFVGPYVHKVIPSRSPSLFTGRLTFF